MGRYGGKVNHCDASERRSSEGNPTQAGVVKKKSISKKKRAKTAGQLTARRKEVLKALEEELEISRGRLKLRYISVLTLLSELMSVEAYGADSGRLPRVDITLKSSS